MTNKVLVTGDFNIPSEYTSKELVHLRTPVSNQDIVTHLKGVRHYIVGGPEYVDDEILRSAPDLKHIIVMGTGTNSFVNLTDAFNHGVHVDNTPGINADAVAEFAIGAVIFNLANSFHSSNDLLQGGWYQKPHRTLSEVSIGIVGLGDIGSKVAKKIKAISPSTELTYFSKTRKKDQEKAIGINYASLEDMVRRSDVIIMCVTYNEGSHHMINSDILNIVKSDAALFNFSNPRTIDPSALKESLTSERLSFTFYDGYYDEWINNKGQDRDQYGLLRLPPSKFVATSHIAAQADGAIESILHTAFAKIEAWKRSAPSITAIRMS